MNWEFHWSWTLPSFYNKPMLEIELKRLSDNAWCTIGSLSMTGFCCSTIELPKQPYCGSPVRIPSGRYAVRPYNSPKHGPDTPLLVGVPGRSEIEIHPSNYAIQPSSGKALLLGCIAPGINPTSVSVDSSRHTCEELVRLIKPFWNEGEVWLTIKD